MTKNNEVQAKVVLIIQRQIRLSIFGWVENLRVRYET